jgi:carbamoyl-phosphate synthase large subunit
MIDRAGRTILKVAAVVGGAALGFILLQGPWRSFETTSSLWLLHLFTAHSVFAIAPTTVLIVPAHHAAFDVLITPSCSSVASLLAFGCLAPLTPRRPWSRRAFAAGTAATVITAGNVLRIAGSIAVGLLAGRSSLVLFHDWVGSMFTFVYTMGGYILMLTMLLPRSAGQHATGTPKRLVLHAA